MNLKTMLLCAVVAPVMVSGVVGAQAREGTMEAPAFVVVPHMNGTLALRTSRISGVWYRAATADKPSQIRVSSPVLGEAKSLSGDDADALWKRVHEGDLSGLFLFAPHMEGILAIPRDQIGTAFYSDAGGQARLRLIYEGDPSGKNIDGEEATRLWKEITASP